MPERGQSLSADSLQAERKYPTRRAILYLVVLPLGGRKCGQRDAMCLSQLKPLKPSGRAKRHPRTSGHLHSSSTQLITYTGWLAETLRLWSVVSAQHQVISSKFTM